jgi:hypothetical protein
MMSALPAPTEAQRATLATKLPINKLPGPERIAQNVCDRESSDKANRNLEIVEVRDARHFPRSRLATKVVAA